MTEPPAPADTPEQERPPSGASESDSPPTRTSESESPPTRTSESESPPTRTSESESPSHETSESPSHETSESESPSHETSESESPRPETSDAPVRKKRRKKKARSAKPASNEWLDLLMGRAPLTFLLIVVGMMMAFTLRGVRHDSPTEDEWAHLVRGIGYYQTSDMRMHVQHPPLANLLDALPSAFEQNPDVTEMKTWKEGYAPGLEYISRDYAHAREQLFRGRYVASLFLLGLVVYAFYFCLSVFGWETAAAAALLLAFNPSLMGQARYVTTDMPVATFAFIAVGELVQYLRNPKRIVTLGLALGGLVLSKHSGVVLLAMVALVAFVAACFGRGFFQQYATLPQRLLRWLGHFAAAGLIVLFAINAVYKFDRTGMSVSDILAAPEPQHWVTKSYKGEMLERRSPLPHLPGSLRIPLPYSYMFGVFAVKEQNRGGYPSYFLGEQSHDGKPLYFPVLLLTKSPPALLALLAVGAYLWLKTAKKRLHERDPARSLIPGLSLASGCFLIIATLFLAFIIRSNLNMGVRHGISVMVLASLLAARAFAKSIELGSPRTRKILIAIAASGALSVLIVTPHYLNYYNLLALGRGGWINVVGDDWGQDREAFVRYAKQRELTPLYYHTQTPTRKLEVDYLGLQYRDINCKTVPEPGSWVAIHSQYVHRFEATPNCALWMRGLNPVNKFNENVWVYKIPN